MRPQHPSPSVHRTEPMSLDRFCALADAYGGDLRRWPEAERGVAQSLAQVSTAARDRIAHAQALDGILDRSRVAPASAELYRKILTQAPHARGATSARSKLLRWLSGLGAIGVLTCGAMAGAAVVAVSAPAHVDADVLSGLYDQPAIIDATGA